jgi:hypothetical protein
MKKLGVRHTGMDHANMRADAKMDRGGPDRLGRGAHNSKVGGSTPPPCSNRGVCHKRSYKPQEKITRFVLRLPHHYSLALDGLVQKDVSKSKNELIVEIIGLFLSDLYKQAVKGLE